MAARRILIVDDQRDVTRMIRTALETLGRGYVLVDVPSGEEAILEIGRGGVDLLITDVRLPGISGLEVIRRLRKTNPAAQTIVISGYGSGQVEADALRLGAAAFFSKPISINEFLKAVQLALNEQPSPAELEPAPASQPGIAERLSSLRRDLGANAVFLVDVNGRIVVRAGDVTRLDMDPVLTHLMTAFSAAMKVCKLLGGYIPTNVHFFDGDEFDIYAANVGQYFALVIIFDGDRGAGQMGPVMRYGRQCADDLLNSLVMMGVEVEPAPAPVLGVKPPTAAPRAAAGAPPSPVRAQTTAPAAKSAATPAPAAEPAPAPAPPPKPLTEKELKALEDAAQKVSSAEAASFWDVALAEAEADSVRPDTLSWEQAEKLGLIPKK